MRSREIVHIIAKIFPDCNAGKEKQKLYNELIHLPKDSTVRRTMEQLCIIVHKNKIGRPIKYSLDFDEIIQRKTNGETDEQIYTSLGISRSLYYLRLREYKKGLRRNNHGRN